MIDTSAQIPLYSGPATSNYFIETFDKSLSDLIQLNSDDKGTSGTTTALTPVIYYKIEITSEMIQTYQDHISIATCCDLHYPHYPIANDNNYTTNCNENQSLDTVLYLFTEKKGYIDLLETVDDSINTTCQNTQKSVIDLTKYDVGTYVVGVGGYRKEYGNFYIHLHCDVSSTKYPTNDPTVRPTLQPTISPSDIPTIDPTHNPTIEPTLSPTLQYSFPIKKEEFSIINYQNISCGTHWRNQSNTNDNLVSYYKFTVKERYLPIRISTCPPQKNRELSNMNQTVYDSHIYIIKQYQQNEIVIKAISGIALCDGVSSEIELNDLVNGDYYAVVQGYENQIGHFFISMTCFEPPPKISKKTLIIALITSFSSFILLFLVYYFCEWIWHCKRNKIWCYATDDDEAINGTINVIITAPFEQSIKFERASSIPLIAVGEEEEEEEEEDVSVTSPSQHNQLIHCSVSSTMDNNNYKDDNITCCEWKSCCTVSFDESDEEMMNETEDYIAGDPRRIDQDKEFTQQLVDNEDVIQLVLSHAIQCCLDQSGIDIYQLLAMRYYDKESRNIRGIKMVKKCGCKQECILISPFIRTLVIAIIVGLAQTVGITIVIYKLLSSYRSADFFEDVCIIEVWRWNEVYSLKILSFLLSLVITFYVSIIINTIQHSGLYEIMDKLKISDMKRIDGVVLWILLIGQTINYYVCLWAVIGSYFIIFETNKGNKMDDGTIDYSHVGLDMILNAVALFFMLELDDVLVSAHDYNDCRTHLKMIMKCYFPDININKQYMSQPMDDDDNDNNAPFAIQKSELDPSGYKTWSSDDFVNWLISINNQRYKRYESQIRKMCKKQNIDGSWIPNIKTWDLIEWNVTDCRDRDALFQQIVRLREEDEYKSQEQIISTKQSFSYDITNYKNWSGEQIINWIISLHSRYDNKYKYRLINVFDEYGINGTYLGNAEKKDLIKWGITDFYDRNEIFQQIRINFKNKNNKCRKYSYFFFYCIVTFFSIFVKVCCYGGGFLAPFFIFFCW